MIHTSKYPPVNPKPLVVYFLSSPSLLRALVLFMPIRQLHSPRPHLAVSGWVITLQRVSDLLDSILVKKKKNLTANTYRGGHTDF